MKPVKVCELTEQLQSTWADRVAADGKQLIVIATLAETEVVADTAMVLQIVGNLIDNARKYTRDAEDNRIWLWVKPSANSRVVFEVEDRGCGVPPSEWKTIFKPFRRGSRPTPKLAVRVWVLHWRSSGRKCWAAQWRIARRMGQRARASGWSCR